MHIILCVIQCSLGFFHSTKGTDSVTFPASAQRYHPRSLFQATLPSNINATTLQSCLRLAISHISPTCGLCKQLYSSICHLSLPSLLIRYLWWLIQCQPVLPHLWPSYQSRTALGSPSHPILLYCFLFLSSAFVTCPIHVGSSSLDISSDNSFWIRTRCQRFCQVPIL